MIVLQHTSSGTPIPAFSFQAASGVVDPNSANNTLNLTSFTMADVPTLPEWFAIILGLMLFAFVAKGIVRPSGRPAV
jgi:hypothetical protein